MNDRRTLLHLACLVVFFCLVNSVLFYANGIKVVYDSARYLQYATAIKSGFYFDPHKFWYIGYSLFVGLFNNDLAAIVVAQYLLSLLAVVSLYYSALILWRSPVISLVVGLLFISFVDISLWNSYILAESLYTSFTCFSIFALVKRVNILLIILLIVFTALIKPTGIALLVAVAMLESRPFKWMIYVLMIVLANKMLVVYGVMENYQLGEVIHGVTKVSDFYNINGLVVTPPSNVYIPSEDLPPVIKIISFVVHHPVYWTQLFFTKLFFLFSHIRPYWSVAHNIFSVLFLLPVYALFVFSLIRSVIPKTILVFGLTFLAIHAISIGLTADDWDGRFLVPMLPVIFLFAGKGLQQLEKRWQKKDPN